MGIMFSECDDYVDEYNKATKKQLDILKKYFKQIEKNFETYDYKLEIVYNYYTFEVFFNIYFRNRNIKSFIDRMDLMDKDEVHKITEKLFKKSVDFIDNFRAKSYKGVEYKWKFKDLD